MLYDYYAKQDKDVMLDIPSIEADWKEFASAKDAVDILASNPDEVYGWITDYEAGKIKLSPAFVEELRQYGDDKVLLAMPTVDGNKMIVMDKTKATELYELAKKEIQKNVYSL